jgi:prepilin-type N-terminal cleavage/methylation domain-containing protein
MKNKGFTMMELMVAIAILIILMGMVAQIARTTSKAHQKEVIISRMDRTLGKTVDLLKRSVRRATNSGGNTYTVPGFGTATNAAIYIAGGENTYGSKSAIIINYSEKDSTDATGTLFVNRQILYEYDAANKRIQIATKDSNVATWGSKETIAENISNAWFMYDEDVLRFQFTIDLNEGAEDQAWKRKVLTDAAVLRSGLNRWRR